MQTFEEFRAAQLERGYHEVVERVWEAGTTVAEHTHAFSVEALVADGDLWLTVAGDTRHLRRGDTFELDADTPHGERYGPEGATYWAARRPA